MLKRALLTLAAGALAACAGAPQPMLENTAAPTPPRVLTLPGYPQTVQARLTTRADNVLANLNGRIAQASGSDLRTLATRSGALYQRYQILGSLADLDEAYRIAQEVAADPQASSDALLLWATIASYMHGFDQATAALDRLPAAEQSKTEAFREDMARARNMRPHQPEPAALPAGGELAMLRDQAADCVEQGDLECASERFHRAQFFYTDSGPLPLAWLHTQQGITLLRFGHPDWAIRFFRAALARVPNYYLAAEHLGECLGLTGSYDEGREVYESVIAQTGNPEYIAGLAGLEKLAGNSDRAEQLLIQARLGFAERLKKFPDAYAQHAVDFYIETGDLATAVALSTRNLELRQDASAYLLKAHVDLASGRTDESCALLAQVAAAGYRPPEFSELRANMPNCRL